MLRGTLGLHQYAAWVERHRVALLVASLALAVACTWVGSQLPLQADLPSLLPASRASVRDYEAIQARARPFGTIHVAVTGEPALRARASARLRERLAQLPSEDVIATSFDDAALHRFVWRHGFSLVPARELASARDAIREHVRRAKAEANPLFISLEDPPPRDERLAKLEGELAGRELAARDPPPRVSRDGRLELLIVYTSFEASDTARAEPLVRRIEAILDEVRAHAPGVELGLSGNVALTLVEHDAVLAGMGASGLITLGLCALGLVVFYRSGRLVLAMVWTVLVGVAATFACARVAIGNLDMLSAFAGTLVVGNGINAGMILVARYQEEVRAGREPREAVPHALVGALRGTLAANATAATAYLSLIVADFRAFRSFGELGAIGMVACWLATFVVLPAWLYVFAHRGWIRPTSEPAIGRLLARLAPRGIVAVVAIAVAVGAAGAVAVHYVASDPFTHDWRDLQSTTDDIVAARRLETAIREGFPAGEVFSGEAYMVAIAVARREDVAPLVARLRADDEARPRRLFTDVRSLDDLAPSDLPRRRELLAEIRLLVDDPAVQAELSEADRALLSKVRPPDDLPPLGDRDVPPELAWPFLERDGSLGKLIVLRGAPDLEWYSVADRLRFADAIAQLPLPPGAVAAGESLVVADIIAAMEHDTPRMVLASLAASILVTLIVLGLTRHALVTIGCGVAGILAMLALCAAVGLRAHFLDVIALPIAIGIGLDYAANLAAREREDGHLGPRHLLATTGGAVLMCSFTTVVAYGSLLLASNAGIRAFGLAALLGELACVSTALLVAPVVLASLRRRDPRR